MRLFVRYTAASSAPPSFRSRGLTRTAETAAQAAGYRLVAGVDEVGRGALAGPVVAAAIILPPDRRVAHVVDSKRLDLAQREYLFHELLSEAVACAVGIVPADLIDRFDIRRASLEAMGRAVAALRPAPDFVLVDGRDKPALSIPQQSIVHGDGCCYCIAAASIIAKVCRDRLMAYLDGLYPRYGFTRNRGYGTPDHLLALQEYGPCFVHRHSFAPVGRLRQLTLLAEVIEATEADQPFKGGQY